MNYCVKCRKKVKTKIIKKAEEFIVYGEPVEIEANILICEKCGNELFDEKLDEESLQNAYSAYREKHKLLSPEEIKTIREK